MASGDGKISLVASAEAKPCAIGRQRGRLFPALQKNPLFVADFAHLHRRFPKGDRKALWSPPQRRNPAKQESKEGTFPCLPKKSVICVRFRTSAPKVSKGRSESPLVASAEAKLRATGRQRGDFPLPSKKSVICSRFRTSAPKVSKGRSESPLVASAEAKLPAKQENKEGGFPPPSTRNEFLVRGFARLRADEVLSHAGKYPKGAGGVQRVHVSWPPPDPPLLSYSAPLAPQGRAQLGSLASLGGPLSPSAQLIPPPAFGRRFIPGMVARTRGSRTLMGCAVLRLCMPQATESSKRTLPVSGKPLLFGRAREGLFSEKPPLAYVACSVN